MCLYFSHLGTSTLTVEIPRHWNPCLARSSTENSLKAPHPIKSDHLPFFPVPFDGPSPSVPDLPAVLFFFIGPTIALRILTEVLSLSCQIRKRGTLTAKRYSIRQNSESNAEVIDEVIRPKFKRKREWFTLTSALPSPVRPSYAADTWWCIRLILRQSCKCKSGG